MNRILLGVCLIVLMGCSQPPEMTARDSIATASGAIKSAQSRYEATCVADNTQQPCVVINKAIAANNLAVDALIAYCAGPAFNAGTGPCVPDKAATPKLQAVVANLDDIMKQLTALTGGN